MEIHGDCDNRFSSVKEAFERNFTEHGDIGASFAATIDGEFVIDMWAGHRDRAKTLPWERDTIVNVFSTTKTMTALSALILLDRGELDVDAPVTNYWPEYGQNGKEGTLVRHFLSHSAGLPGFGEKLTKEQLYSWDTVVEVLARQEPWWQPGTMGAYHAITQGFLVGELVRRISGQSLGTFFKNNVAQPLDADFHIGLDPQHFDRTAEMLGGVAPPQLPDPDQIPDYMKGREQGTPNVMPPETNSSAWRQSEIPAANGHGNARSVVRAQTAVANGGTAFGVDLLSQGTIDRIFEEQCDLLGMGVKHGIGYGIASPASAVFMGIPEEIKLTFWGGAGGSTIMLDHTNRVVLSYVMNQMDMRLLGDTRGRNLTASFYAALSS